VNGAPHADFEADAETVTLSSPAGRMEVAAQTK
jgi:hypothetical protein